jgi:hypothetical protein
MFTSLTFAISEPNHRKDLRDPGLCRWPAVIKREKLLARSISPRPARNQTMATFCQIAAESNVNERIGGSCSDLRRNYRSE